MKQILVISLVAWVFVACYVDESGVNATQSVCKDDEASCFEKECSKGDNLSCLRLAELTYWGQGGLAKDEKKAISIIMERCDSGYAFACEKIADLYLFGDANIKADRDEAKRYYDKSSVLYRKACDENYAAACYRLGYLHLYGSSNFFGNMSIEKDLNKTVSYYDKSCKLNYKLACRNLGNFYRKGISVTQSESKAKELFDKACTMDSELCIWIGDRYKFDAKDYETSKTYYKKSCDLGYAWGCDDLGMLYFNGLGMAKDDKKATQYFTKACDIDKMGFVCHHIATQYKETGDLATAKVYDEKACKLGHQRACEALR